MSLRVLTHASLILLGTFLASVSQVILKKAAMQKHETILSEYLNPLVIGAYSIYLITTLLSVLAYRGIPLSMGPILESTSYAYVTFFGVRIFGERMTRRKWIALALIVLGIAVYAVGM